MKVGLFLLSIVALLHVHVWCQKMLENSGYQWQQHFLKGHKSPTLPAASPWPFRKNKTLPPIRWQEYLCIRISKVPQSISAIFYLEEIWSSDNLILRATDQSQSQGARREGSWVFSILTAQQNCPHSLWLSGVLQQDRYFQGLLLMGV